MVKLEKVNAAMDTGTRAAGLFGALCYAGLCATFLFNIVKDTVKDRKRKQYQKGFDDAARQKEAYIEFLKEQNDKLLRKSLDESEGKA